MPKRARHHVNPLKLEYQGRVCTPVELPSTGEVEVELGCADAQFLFARAAAHPHVACVGIEIRRDLVEWVNQRARELALANLHVVFANINTDLELLFPDGRLARMFLNFPDPWFKRRHHKRRVLVPEVAATIARKLAPGGVLFFQSDVEELARSAQSVLEAVGPQVGLACVDGERAFTIDNTWGARSLREDRCQEKGMRIWRLTYRKA